MYKENNDKRTVLRTGYSYLKIYIWSDKCVMRMYCSIIHNVRSGGAGGMYHFPEKKRWMASLPLSLGHIFTLMFSLTPSLVLFISLSVCLSLALSIFVSSSLPFSLILSYLFTPYIYPCLFNFLLALRSMNNITFKGSYSKCASLFSVLQDTACYYCT